jgi:pimeloyl-ACP methyl ester carboxylesterase
MTSALEAGFDAAVRRSLDWLDILSRYEQVAVVADLAVRAEAAARLPLKLVPPRHIRPLATAARRRTAEQAARAQRDSRWASGGSLATLPVFFHEDGPGTSRRRPPRIVLLLNGWTASGLMWPATLIEQLARDHQVLRIDNRGTGWSRTARAPFTVADLADDAAHVLDRIGGGAATVVGFSMGGMVAQELALRRPDLVASLVLVGTRPPGPKQILPAPDAIRPLLEGPKPDQTFDAYLAHLWSFQTETSFATHKPELLAELVQSQTTRPTPMSGVRRQMQAIAAWHGADRLRSLTVPTTIVHGARDRMMPIGNGMNLARLIKDSQFLELPQTGHLVPYEEPAALIEVINRQRSRTR